MAADLESNEDWTFWLADRLLVSVDIWWPMQMQVQARNRAGDTGVVFLPVRPAASSVEPKTLEP
jgi:hypothetical protein